MAYIGLRPLSMVEQLRGDYGSHWDTRPAATGYSSPGGTSYVLPSNVSQSNVQQNLGAMGGISAIAAQINAMNIAAQQAANAARIPGATALEEASSANIAAGLAGEIDPGTREQLGQWAAERGITSGAVGAPVNETAYLEAMGKTAYQRELEAQDLLTKAYARNPGAAIYDPSALLTTPAQYGSYLTGRAQLSETERSNRAQEALEAMKISRSGGGGGGGGGGAPGGRVTTTPAGGAAAPSVSYSSGTGYVMPAGETTPSTMTPSFSSPISDRFWDINEPTGEFGNVPTSSGSMYIGSLEGYGGN